MQLTDAMSKPVQICPGHDFSRWSHSHWCKLIFSCPNLFNFVLATIFHADHTQTDANYFCDVQTCSNSSWPWFFTLITLKLTQINLVMSKPVCICPDHDVHADHTENAANYFCHVQTCSNLYWPWIFHADHIQTDAAYFVMCKPVQITPTIIFHTNHIQTNAHHFCHVQTCSNLSRPWFFTLMTFKLMQITFVMSILVQICPDHVLSRWSHSNWYFCHVQFFLKFVLTMIFHADHTYTEPHHVCHVQTCLNLS